MPMRPRSLAGRLMLASLVAVAAATVAAVVVMLATTMSPGATERLLRADVADAARDIGRGLSADRAGKVTLRLTPDQLDIYDAVSKDAAFLVRGPDGRTIARSAEGPALRALRGMSPSARIVLVENGSADIRLHVLEDVVVVGRERYTVRVARSERLFTELNDYAGQMYLRAGIVTLLLALATFTVVAWLTVHRMVRPLRRASATAARVGPRNLGARLRSDGLPTEVAPLIDAFNAALARLETGFRVQREFLASAAHELKTPLALLQAQIELNGTAEKALLLRDTALMARQVHQLLHLAEVSEDQNYAFGPIDLRTVVEDGVDYLTRLAGQRGIAVTVERQGERDAALEGDGAAVFVLVKNLLENAIHHAPAGSQVHVRITARGFSVEDQGPGIAEGDYAHLFKRFWRGDSRDGEGAGLGLAICMEICQAHGWSIQADPPRASGGARFVVRTLRGEDQARSAPRLPIATGLR